MILRALAIAVILTIVWLICAGAPTSSDGELVSGDPRTDSALGPAKAPRFVVPPRVGRSESKAPIPIVESRAPESLGLRVLDWDGAPVPFATAEVTRVRGALREHVGDFVADEHGELRVARSEVCAGLSLIDRWLSDFSWRVGAGGYRDGTVWFVSEPGYRKFAEKVILERGGMVRGRLFNERGGPAGIEEDVSGVRIALHGDEWIEIDEVDHGVDGWYSFVAPATGVFRVDVAHPELGTARSDAVMLDPSRDCRVPDLVLTATGEIRGRVVDSVGQAVGGVYVYVEASDPVDRRAKGASSGGVLSGRDGDFRFCGLSQARYEIAVDDHSHYEDEAVEAGGPPVVLRLHKTKVRVRVMGGDGAPIPGSILRTEGVLQGAAVARKVENQEVQRSDGCVDLLLSPGAYHASAYSEGARSERYPFVVQAGVLQREVSLTLGWVGVGDLQATIVDQEGEPVEIATLSLRPDEPSVMEDVPVGRRVTSDPPPWVVAGNGLAPTCVSGLTAGRYQLRICPRTNRRGQVRLLCDVVAEIQIEDGIVTHVHKSVQIGGKVTLSQRVDSGSTSRSFVSASGVTWTGEDGREVRLHPSFKPSAPGISKAPLELIRFSDVLPTGPGKLRVPTADGWRTIAAVVRPNETTVVALEPN